MYYTVIKYYCYTFKKKNVLVKFSVCVYLCLLKGSSDAHFPQVDMIL